MTKIASTRSHEILVMVLTFALMEDGNKELSFPEFLRLMKKLQSDNWNGINAAAKEVSERSVQRLEETTPTARRKNSKMDWHAIIGD